MLTDVPNGRKKHNSEQMQRMRKNLRALHFHQAIRGLRDVLSEEAFKRIVGENGRKLKHGK